MTQIWYFVVFWVLVGNPKYSEASRVPRAIRPSIKSSGQDLALNFTMTSGPAKRDGAESIARIAEGNLPFPNDDLTTTMFIPKGFGGARDIVGMLGNSRNPILRTPAPRSQWHRRIPVSWAQRFQRHREARLNDGQHITHPLCHQEDKKCLGTWDLPT